MSMAPAKFLATVIPAIMALLVVATPVKAGWLEAMFAPKAKLWERWTANDPASTATIDHAAWDRFLKVYVVANADGVNRVAYGRVAAADRAALDGYIRRLAAVPISRFRRDAQRAYWINLYNALTVQVVLDHYPVASIHDIDISPGAFASGPWDRNLVEIEGKDVSLNDIEHRILRPIWRDARVHYVLNCASIGCPELMPEAFTAANTEAQLDAAARAYINHPRGWRFDGERLIVSSIYVWYRADFGRGDGDVIAHLKRYSTPERAARLDSVGRISGDVYDWALNDADPKAGGSASGTSTEADAPAR